MSTDADKARRLGLDGAENWSTIHALAKGWLIITRVPSAVIFAASTGFGAIAHDAGWDLGLSLFLATMFFALPAQVMLVDQVMRGAAIAAAAFAVTLTAVRLLPMTVSLMPLLRNQGRLSPWATLAVHFVAISTWIEAFNRLPLLPPAMRLRYFIGMGLGMLTASLSGTILGFVLAGSVPPLLGAVLLFMSPSFFFLSLVGTARIRPDWIAIGLGCLLGPIFYQLIPGLDLLATGVIGGSIAFWLAKRAKAVPPR